MERFALKVDFSAFHNEEVYEKVMILVDPQWPNVASIENRLKKMFKIDCGIGFKSSEGFYIPPEEPIEILKYVNMLIAFKSNNLTEKQHTESKKPLEKSKSLSNTIKSHSQPSNDPEIITTVDFVSKSKRKHRLLMNEANFTTSTPAANIAKRLKGVHSGNMQDELSPVAYNDLVEERKKTKSLDKVPKDIPKELSYQQIKSTSEVKIPSVVNADIDKSKTKNHMFFNETSKEVNSKKEENLEEHISKIEIVFHCDLENTNQNKGRGRVFKINRKQSTENHIDVSNLSKEVKAPENPANNIEIIENLTVAKPIDQSNGGVHDASEKFVQSVEKTNTTINSLRSESSLELSTMPSENTESIISCDESDVIEFNESGKIHSIRNRERKCSSGSESITDNSNNLSLKIYHPNLSEATPLTDLPNIGDNIVFKTWLSNNKLSENFLGKCEYTNKRMKTIKLQLIENHSQMRYLPQKLTGGVDDSIELKILNIKLQEMIEPKVFRMK